MSELERRNAIHGEVVDSPARTLPVVPQALSFASAIRRLTLKLALTSLAATAVFAYALLRDGFPSSTARAVVTVIVIVAAAAPLVVLAAFWQALGELIALPERLRRLPMDGREHVSELGRAVRDARKPSGAGRFHSPRLLWRLTRLTASSRELLTPYAGVVPLFSVSFLTLVALAGAAVLLEALIALIVLLALALT